MLFCYYDKNYENIGKCIVFIISIIIAGICIFSLVRFQKWREKMIFIRMKEVVRSGFSHHNIDEFVNMIVKNSDISQDELVKLCKIIMRIGDFSIYSYVKDSGFERVWVVYCDKTKEVAFMVYPTGTIGKNLNCESIKVHNDEKHEQYVKDFIDYLNLN